MIEKSEKELIQARLKEARGQMSAEILGDRLNVRNGTVYRWERGKGLPSQILMFKKFCQETKVNPLWILGLEDLEK